MSLEDLELTDDPTFEPEPSSDRVEPSSAHDSARLELALRVLRQMQDSLGNVISLLEGSGGHDEALQHVAKLMVQTRVLADESARSGGARSLEGVFDGVSMIGSDGAAYPIPQNYASKSRLVEGDVMKLTIRADGTFVFKQVGPVERRRVVGCVGFDASSGSHVVVCGEMAYKVLPATVSYYRAEPGDEAVILVPKSRKSVWAAVENVVKT